MSDLLRAWDVIDSALDSPKTKKQRRASLDFDLKVKAKFGNIKPRKKGPSNENKRNENRRAEQES